MAETKTLEIVRGELTHKEEKLSSNNKIYWLLEIAGIGKSTCWDKKVTDSLTVGKTYEYETEYDGKYRNVKSIKDVVAISSAEPPASGPATPPEHQQGYVPVQKDNQAIMAQVALKSAVERANCMVGVELTTAAVIQMGQEFFIAMKAWAIGKLIAPEQPSVSGPPPASAKPATVTPETRIPNLNPDWVKAVDTHLTKLGYPSGDKRDRMLAKKFSGVKVIAQLAMKEAEAILASPLPVEKTQLDEDIPF